VLTQAGAPGFAGAWLRHRGLDWAADLLPFPAFLSAQPLENLP
jgi:type IV secretion system protein VirB4